MYAAARVPDRKYLWTVVSLFTLLGLLGLGVLLYKPLHLRYAVYKVQHTTWEQWCRDFEKGTDDAYLRCLEECTAAACKGNRLAMEAVIDASGFGDGYIAEMTCDVAYKVAASRPEAFFDALQKRSDQKVLEVLNHIVYSACIMNLHNPIDYQEGAGPDALVAEFGAIHRHTKGPASLMASSALDFIRRRFAQTLASAFEKTAIRACAGDSEAMRTLLDSLAMADKELPLYGLGFQAAAAQPRPFFSMADKKFKGEAESVLWWLVNDCIDAERGPGAGGHYCNIQLKLFAVDFAGFSKSEKPDVRRVAQAALDFARRRFAKELAEAEKATPKPKKPAP